MKFTLRLLPAADADIDDIAAYIAHDSMDAALRFLDAIDDTLRLIREHPKRQALYGFRNERLHDVRRRAVIGFPKFLIFYRVSGRVVEVIRVLHGARDLTRALGGER